MRFRVIQANQKLQDVVNHYWLLEIESCDVPFEMDLLPYGRFELFFELNGTEAAFYSGHLRNSKKVIYESPLKAIGVAIKPWAADFFFSIPAQHFSNQITPINLVSDFREISDVLNSVVVEEELILTLDRFLLKRLKNYQVDLLSKSLTDRLFTHSNLPLQSLSFFNIGLSRRRIEQRFIKHTGVSMGRYLSILRYEQALTQLKTFHSKSMTEMSLELGYYDQSHFIREFKSYVGLTPKQFVQQTNTIQESNLKELMFL